jgi:hypothetical protein
LFTPLKEELALHTYIEEQVFYLALQQAVGGVEKAYSSKKCTYIAEWRSTTAEAFIVTSGSRDAYGTQKGK